MLSQLRSYDLETRLFVPGLMAPPIVCASTSEVGPSSERLIVGEECALNELKAILAGGKTIVGANIAFDMVCAAQAASVRQDMDLIREIFRAYDEDRVFDVLLAQALDAIAGGHLGKDPRTGGPLKSPSTGKQSERYSLEIVTDLMLGRKDAKKNDFYRLRYAILEKVPFNDWPEEARQYPLDDARNTIDVAVAQLGAAGDRNPLRNLHNLPSQCRAAFALQLSTVWGLRTDAATLDDLEKHVLEVCAKQEEKFKGKFIKEDGRDDKPAIKRAVCKAYGVTGICPNCGGSGKAVSEVSGNKVNCKACDSTGFDLSTAPDLPLTKGGGVSAARDTLKECGDEELEEFGASEMRKLRDTYLPALRQGTTRPLTENTNAILANGRASRSGVSQTLPRKHNVRSAIVPRQGWLFCSSDYNYIELCTLAQCQYWMLGKSTLGDAINAGLDPHTKMAAQLLGIPYEEAIKRKNAWDKTFADYRQASKPINFGFPGGMGVPRFIIQARKDDIRFCKLLGGAEICGLEKVTEWNRKPCTPICKLCAHIADDARSQWFKAWPEMKPYFDWVSRRVDNTGEIEQFVSGRIRGGLSFCDGANTLFSALAADGGKAAFYRITKESYTNPKSPLYDNAKASIFIHDEWFGEVKEETAHITGPLISDLMVEEMTRYVPDVTIKAAPALMRRWEKAAEPVYRDGKLVVWEAK